MNKQVQTHLTLKQGKWCGEPERDKKLAEDSVRHITKDQSPVKILDLICINFTESLLLFFTIIVEIICVSLTVKNKYKYFQIVFFNNNQKNYFRTWAHCKYC